MATPTTEKHERTVTGRGSGASPITTTLAAPPAGSATVVDHIYVTNTTGGTATTATVSIQRVSDSAVLWEVDVTGAPAVAPGLDKPISLPGGIYKGLDGIQLKVVVTMAGATALKVNVMSHEETS